MAIPQGQISKLKAALRDHESRREQLKVEEKSLQREIRAHDAILSLGRNRKIVVALNELVDEPELIDELKRNPAAYARERGITLPRGTVVKASGSDSDALVVEAVLKVDDRRFSVRYDSEDGFTAKQLQSS